MIEYLLSAFFVAQPVSPVAAAVTPAAPPAAPAARAPVEISSKRVTGSRAQAVFSGDVVVRQRTLELRCDEMTASYNGPREVTRVVCAGNMRAVDGDRAAQGAQADLDVPTGSLAITGAPEASDPTTRLKGSLVRLRAGLRGPEYEVDSPVVTLETVGLKGARKGPGSPAEISARKLSGSRTQAVFSGDVVAHQRTLELRCDKLVAFYNAAREVQRAECVGGVRAVDGDRQARGERADFNVSTGVLVLTGNPEARDSSTRLRGSEVRMTVGNSNFEVKDAVITVESAPSPDGRTKGAGKGAPGGTPDTGGAKQP